MANESKKISFGFTKLTKKTNIIPKPPSKRQDIQLIECLESQTIKLKDHIDEIKGPLVIPLPTTADNTILDRRKDLKTKEENGDERPDCELTPDELAAKELIREARNLSDTNGIPKVFKLSTQTTNVIEIEGKPESTIEDYDSVPISEYGLAMLRGMGWSEGVAIGKTTKSVVKMKEPTLRPKGMGLGVNGVIQGQLQKPLIDKDGKELVLKKGSCAKIINGKLKANYCEVLGFDDEAGRIIVKTTLQGLILSLNEFMVVAVTKDEYLKSSKVINNAKFEEYKQKTEFKEETKEVKKEKSMAIVSSSESKHSASKDDKKRDHKKKSKKKHRSSSASSEASEEYRREKSRRHKHKKDHEHNKHTKKKERK